MAKRKFQIVSMVLAASVAAIQLLIVVGAQDLKVPPSVIMEKEVFKRALCHQGGGDKAGSCPSWMKLGFCESGHTYAAFMQKTCPASCGHCQARPTEAPKAFAVSVNKNKCLQAHNSKRALHGAVPLVWDDSLAQSARKWAVHLANANTFEHSRTRGQGENLYYSARTGSVKLGNCEDAVQAWYDEVKDYPFWNPPNSIFDVKGKMIGHFTQIVWKSTRRVGVGVATIKRGWWTKTYVVARYTPPGNYQGRLAKEVGDLNVSGF